MPQSPVPPARAEFLKGQSLKPDQSPLRGTFERLSAPLSYPVLLFMSLLHRLTTPSLVQVRLVPTSSSSGYPSPSAHPPELSPNATALLTTWIAIYSTSQAFLLLLLCTLVFRKREAHKRGWMLINMLVCMLADSVASCLLYYAGEQATPVPPYGLCLAQATIKHGTAAMIVVSELSLVTHLFLSIRALLAAPASTIRHDSRLLTVWLLFVPYLTGLAWALPVAVMGSQHPGNVERLLQSYYCSYNNNLFGDIGALFGVCAIFTIAGLLSSVAVTLYHSWADTHKSRASGRIDVSLVVRLCIFVAVQIVYIGVSVIGVADQHTRANNLDFDVSSILEALTPAVIFVLFGLRKQYLAIWFAPLIPLLPSALAARLKFLAPGGSPGGLPSFSFSFSLQLPRFLTPEPGIVPQPALPIPAQPQPQPQPPQASPDPELGITPRSAYHDGSSSSSSSVPRAGSSGEMV